MLTDELALWRERFGEHLAMRGLSPCTVKIYTAELKPLFAFLETQGVEHVAELTSGHLEGYRSHLFYLRWRGKSLSLATQGLRLAAVKRFARFLCRAGFHLVDVGVSLELPMRPRNLPRVILSEDETVRLVEAPDVSTPLGLRDRAALELLYGTALRNAELRALELGHLDFGRRSVHIVRGKGAKARVLPLGEEAQVWLEEYLVRGRPALVQDEGLQSVFLSNGGRACSSRCLTDMVQAWGRRAGLEKTVTPHVLRHSCATHMLRRGAGLRQLQVLLGHSSPDTTQVYTHVEVSDLRKVLRRCHPRERP